MSHRWLILATIFFYRVSKIKHGKMKQNGSDFWDLGKSVFSPVIFNSVDPVV